MYEVVGIEYFHQKTCFDQFLVHWNDVLRTFSQKNEIDSMNSRHCRARDECCDRDRMGDVLCRARDEHSAIDLGVLCRARDGTRERDQK